MYLNTNKLIQQHILILEILNQNNKDNAKFVGGCVRDYLKYNTISQDIDISTILEPNEVISIIKDYKKNKNNNKECNIIILDKDKAYGTIIVIFENKKTNQKQKYEITTTRADISCFGRQAQVKFCKDFKQDSIRRDFTINALYLGIDGEILDFHNGIEDLNNNRIIFIGDANSRIKEDYLRIVRFFRFATKFNNFNFDKSVLDIITANKNELNILSRERIRSEIFKMLEYDNWFFGLKSLHNNNLIKNIFQIETYNINTDENKNLNNNLLKLFYFFNYDKNIMEELKEKLKFTKEEKKFCDFFTNIFNISKKGTEFNIELKIQIYNNSEMFLICKELFNKEIQEKIEIFIKNIKKLPITTQDLIDAGFSGKVLGEKIKAITKIWIENDFKITKNELLKQII